MAAKIAAGTKTMDRTVQGVIAAVLAVVILAVAAYGSYLPLRKAELFISTLGSFQSQPPTSLQDFEGRLSTPLDYPSPIGQEELVRNTANSILGILQRGVGPTSTVMALVDFVQGYYDPIIARGKGMSFGQDLYLEGAMNELAFVATGEGSFLNATRQYYSEGVGLGPNRPQSLYGLFDVYRASGDATDAIAVGQKILSNWPSDQNVQAVLGSLLQQSHATSSQGVQAK